MNNREKYASSLLAQLKVGDVLVFDGYTVSKGKVAANRYNLPIFKISRGGVTKTIRDVARETGFPFSTLMARVNRQVSYAELFAPKRGSIDLEVGRPDPFPVPPVPVVYAPVQSAAVTSAQCEADEVVESIPERVKKSLDACYFSAEALFLCGASKVFPALPRAAESGVELYYCRNGHSKRQGVTA